MVYFYGVVLSLLDFFFLLPVVDFFGLAFWHVRENTVFIRVTAVLSCEAF